MPRAKGRSSKRRRDRDPVAPAWLAWIAENLLAGAPRDALEEALRVRGVSNAELRATLAAIEESPLFVAATRQLAQARRVALVVRLQRELAATRMHPRSVARIENPGAEAFFDRYYATGTPVVFTDVVRAWPAFGKWSPEHLRDTYGDVEVLAATGRNDDPDCDLHTPALSRTMPLRAFAERVLAAGETNDLYLVANHRNSDLPGLRALFDDVVLPAGILDPARLRGCTALWFGPAGTVTPLHHDTSNILFANVYGTKRFVLIPPWETGLLGCARGVYSQLDPERPDLEKFPWFPGVCVHEVELAAGEMLFLPAGWWHHVRARSVSINIAFTNFTRSNAFDWFRPGER